MQDFDDRCTNNCIPNPSRERDESLRSSMPRWGASTEQRRTELQSCIERSRSGVDFEGLSLLLRISEGSSSRIDSMTLEERTAATKELCNRYNLGVVESNGNIGYNTIDAIIRKSEEQFGKEDPDVRARAAQALQHRQRWIEDKDVLDRLPEGGGIAVVYPDRMRNPRGEVRNSDYERERRGHHRRGGMEEITDLGLQRDALRLLELLDPESRRLARSGFSAQERFEILLERFQEREGLSTGLYSQGRLDVDTLQQILTRVYERKNISSTTEGIAQRLDEYLEETTGRRSGRREPLMRALDRENS